MSFLSSSVLLSTVIGDIHFQVYRAKDFFSSDWNSDQLKKLVAEARNSFRVYNPEIPLFDEYDQKSAIYLVSASYPIAIDHDTVEVEEWVSLRFVPLVDSPETSLDILHYHYLADGEELNILELLQRKTEEFQDVDIDQVKRQVVTQSRLCAIRPKAVDPTKQYIINEYWTRKGYITKNKHTALAYAIIQKQFLYDCRNLQHLPIYMTAQMNKTVSDAVLLYKYKHVGMPIQLSSICHTLHLSNTEKVSLNREKHWDYFYEYPGYFLDLSDLTKLLHQLIYKELLSQTTLQQYLDGSWEDVFAKPHYSQFCRMGQFLKMEGLIPESKITGQELREMINQQVQDGITLRLVKTDSFEQTINELLELAVVQQKLL